MLPHDCCCLAELAAEPKLTPAPYEEKQTFECIMQAAGFIAPTLQASMHPGILQASIRFWNQVVALPAWDLHRDLMFDSLQEAVTPGPCIQGDLFIEKKVHSWKRTLVLVIAPGLGFILPCWLILHVSDCPFALAGFRRRFPSETKSLTPIPLFDRLGRFSHAGTPSTHHRLLVYLSELLGS